MYLNLAILEQSAKRSLVHGNEEVVVEVRNNDESQEVHNDILYGLICQYDREIDKLHEHKDE